MAIQATYTFEKENELKHVIENAYLRIVKVNVEVEDVEQYIKAPENEENIDQIMQFSKRVEGRAIAQVFSSKEARDNHAYPLDVFGFNFKYDEEKGSVFNQAYAKLATLEHRLDPYSIAAV